MNKTTEESSKYDNLEKMSFHDLLSNINKEDKTVAYAVEKAINEIEEVAEKALEVSKNGGRIFYLGSGTSGRLGIVDASELLPTFGLEDGNVIGLIAGGDKAIRKAQEFAEDNLEQGWLDLKKHKISSKDMVIGISASGTTPYVLGAIKKCDTEKIATASITCNEESPIAQASQLPIKIIVGPEFVTGSTRMKAGTAQKMVLNMISTSVMIKLGHIKGNIMIDMRATNNKLVDRSIKIIMNELHLDYEEAEKRLKKFGSIRKVING